MKSISAKLGIWPNDRLLLVNPNPKTVERIQAEQHGMASLVFELPPEAKTPMVLIWLREGDDATALANRYKQVLDDTGQLWFFFPKKETMRANQLTVTRETVEQDVCQSGLEMTKICSIDADTQAMGFAKPLNFSRPSL